ncbi:MAG: glutamate synthase large subunit [Acidimicrobiia bacterium]|nr:glutamate synthase large subunit [bacterium]MXX00549.1 glutamate synthase large subunit [Acidimicrobiia bacterium]MXX45631.1 glutamate synthase large subunit [Acidimicrobiia bacterium]MXY74726.1 glutamate synthase large subunit [Acidimicrobiia bacterium]MYB78904.1 glutamate synthase large subunit [Acidimicrobiia bacterium]
MRSSNLINDLAARFHHDACGVGLIAARDRRPSHRMTRFAVECLVRLDHRGAKVADGTGDGAGLLTQIPHRLLSRYLRSVGVAPPDRLGVVMAFLPGEDPRAGERVVAEGLSAEGLPLLAWRSVPTDPQALSDRARQLMPVMRQALVGAPDTLDSEQFERSMLLARKRMERAGQSLASFSIPSASARTVVYKGLFTAARIADFYWDLTDPDYHTAFAIFHQRYSTNTFPAWEIAQPFRCLAHNGEINTISANRSWMKAREQSVSSTVWGERTVDLRPFVQPGLSDSASLDNVFELLLRTGRSLPHIKEMLIQPAWESAPTLGPEEQDFYEYHASLTEPWDGPAALAVTDGVSLLAAMDRNGLRPARWTITPEMLIVASEAGVCPSEEVWAERTGQLGPGEMVLFDGETGQIRFSNELRPELCRLRPYRDWMEHQTLHIQKPFSAEVRFEIERDRLCRVFGYTAEERRLILAEMALGKSPLGSMGSDTPLAAFSGRPRRLAHYFHQQFAQVTNPPMDPIREQSVMSLRTYLGGRGSFLEDSYRPYARMELLSPVLSLAELETVVRSGDPRFFSHWIPCVWPAVEGREGMKRRLDQICEEAVEATEKGASIIVLSDREVDGAHAPVPMLLAVGAVHQRLIRSGLRVSVSIVAVSGETRDSHDLACLIAYGASAVNPYLAIREVMHMAQEGVLRVHPVEAQENYRNALQNGLLKVMSKMGICTVSAYRGSELFEALGLEPEVLDYAFPNTSSRLSGRGFGHLAWSALRLHALYSAGEEVPGGFYKQRGGGEFHVTSPRVVLALHKAARSGAQDDWDRYLETIQQRPVTHIRDLCTFVERTPVLLSEVEPAESIMRRFVTSAMSHGALSREAHEALAEAMNRIGGHSNSGEGGEGADRYGTPRNSSIKQVASGRFGVTPAYLYSARELQIKMAQGSKPGEGGQLPGHKVSAEIARLRHTKPGVTLISPPPHHDIYSIEDLAQLIYDLKTFKPSARVSVKLVSEPGVGTIAAGVVKARADVILISGTEGGTGASPLESIKHAGSPWELGLAEAHQTLSVNGLRGEVELEADGGLRTGRDVVIAALLGADRFGFGTLPLLALGCKMVRQCHLNTCPVGIATQREDLRARYTGEVDQVVAVFRMLAEEARRYLALLGARTLDEVVGRADLLAPVDHPLAAGLAELLVRFDSHSRHPGYRPFAVSKLSRRLAAEATEAIENEAPVRLSYPISNTDRTVGARLSGMVTARYGAEGLPEDSVSVMLSGTAGQSLGAWLAPGISLRLDGVANDYVGKGMGGGRIVVVPRRNADQQAVSPQAGGNAVMYGATGGLLLMSGAVGQRFAVRNSGGTAVVEGCSDHGCEYMTGGRALILGPVGSNFAAGMTGGVSYVWDPEFCLHGYLADTSPAVRRPTGQDAEEIRRLVSLHLQHTQSPVADKILGSWSREAPRFWVLEAARRAPLTPILPLTASTAP